jgi:hypothetical protein
MPTKILDGKFEIVGVKPGPVGTKIGVVDLRKLDEKTAQRLVDIKMPYIRRVTAPQEKDSKK